MRRCDFFGPNFIKIPAILAIFGRLKIFIFRDVHYLLHALTIENCHYQISYESEYFKTIRRNAPICKHVFFRTFSSDFQAVLNNFRCVLDRFHIIFCAFSASLSSRRCFQRHRRSIDLTKIQKNCLFYTLFTFLQVGVIHKITLSGKSLKIYDSKKRKGMPSLHRYSWMWL